MKTTRRTERIGNLIREEIGRLVLSKISDPRIDPALTSITHVEVADDLLSAKVHVSVMADAPAQRKAVRALQHASGRIQEMMMRDIRLRNTPVLSFHIDAKFKKTLKTLELIQEAMNEIEQKGPQEATPAIEGEGGE